MYVYTYIYLVRYVCIFILIKCIYIYSWFIFLVNIYIYTLEIYLYIYTHRNIYYIYSLFQNIVIPKMGNLTKKDFKGNPNINIDISPMDNCA